MTISEFFRIESQKLKMLATYASLGSAKDDEGKDWSHDVPEVVYDPDCPYCLLGIPFLGKFFATRTGDSAVYDDETIPFNTFTF